MKSENSHLKTVGLIVVLLLTILCLTGCVLKEKRIQKSEKKFTLDLAGKSNHQKLNYLEPFLSGNDVVKKRAAIRQTGQIKNYEPAENRLIKMLESGETHIIKKEIILALGNLGSVNSRNTVYQFALNHKNYRCHAIKGFIKGGVSPIFTEFNILPQNDPWHAEIKPAMGQNFLVKPSGAVYQLRIEIDYHSPQFSEYRDRSYSYTKTGKNTSCSKKDRKRGKCKETKIKNNYYKYTSKKSIRWEVDLKLTSPAKQTLSQKHVSIQTWYAYEQVSMWNYPDYPTDLTVFKEALKKLRAELEETAVFPLLPVLYPQYFGRAGQP